MIRISSVAYLLLIASVCVREDAVYPPGIRHDHGRIAGAKFLACIPECLDEYGGVRLRTRHISVEIFGCEPFVGARPILCVGCGAEASLEMLQNSLPLALPANAVDEIAKALGRCAALEKSVCVGRRQEYCM